MAAAVVCLVCPVCPVVVNPAPAAVALVMAFAPVAAQVALAAAQHRHASNSALINVTAKMIRNPRSATQSVWVHAAISVAEVAQVEAALVVPCPC